MQKKSTITYTTKKFNGESNVDILGQNVMFRYQTLILDVILILDSTEVRFLLLDYGD